MFEAAFKALAQMTSPEFRRVLFKSLGLALVMIVVFGIGLHRLFSWLAQSGTTWAEASPASCRTPPGASCSGCSRSPPRSASSPARCS